MTSVVIVDDHEAVREGLAAVLRATGVDVLATVGNAAAGMDVLDVVDPEVAILDIGLPDVSGIDLTRSLLHRFPRIGVVLYTGDTTRGLVADGLGSGARGYALKTGSVAELVGAIATVANGGTYVDPRVSGQATAGQAGAGPRLSPREREVVQLIAEGMTAEDASLELGVSVDTVRTHVRNVIGKLQARNRVHAISIAIERGEITLAPGAG